MAGLKWMEMAHGTFDAPLWPDIAMNKEDLLKKTGLAGLAKRMARGNDRRLCILDYFAGRNPGMEGDVLKYGHLERLPEWIKRHWAHHQYFIFTPK